MDNTTLQEALTNSLREALSGFTQSISSGHLVNIRPPEFTGQRGHNIVEWLDQFESATTGLNDDQKKLILPSAFKKAARAWFKSDLEPIMLTMRWREVKQEIINRYKPNQLDYYIEKLAKLKFTGTDEEDLAAFVDKRIYLCKLAYPKSTDQEIIRGTMLAMSDTVRSYINLMSDTDKLETITEFKQLAKRYDQKIKIDDKHHGQPELNAKLFQELLENAVSKVVNSIKEKSDNSEVLAATRYAQNHQPNVNYRQYNQQKPSYGRGQDRPVPYACRFCGAMHWHHQCPVNPRNQGPQHQHQQVRPIPQYNRQNHDHMAQPNQPNVQHQHQQNNLNQQGC